MCDPRVLVTHGVVTTALVAGAVWCAVPRTIPLQLTVWVRRESATDEASCDEALLTKDTGPLVPECDCAKDNAETLVLTDALANPDDWVSTDHA